MWSMRERYSVVVRVAKGGKRVLRYVTLGEVGERAWVAIVRKVGRRDSWLEKIAASWSEEDWMRWMRPRACIRGLRRSRWLSDGVDDVAGEGEGESKRVKKSRCQRCGCG